MEWYCTMEPFVRPVHSYTLAVAKSEYSLACIVHLREIHVAEGSCHESVWSKISAASCVLNLSNLST